MCDGKGLASRQIGKNSTSFLFFVEEARSSSSSSWSWPSSLPAKEHPQRCHLRIIILSCVMYQGGSNKQLGEKMASDVGRQIRQADVMLKSAVLLTKRWWWLHWMIMTEILQSYQEMIWTSAVTELLGYQNTFKFWTKKPLWLWRKLTWKVNSGDCDFVWNSHSGNFTSMWLPTASNFTDGWSTGASDKIQMSCRYFSNSENLP